MMVLVNWKVPIQQILLFEAFLATRVPISNQLSTLPLRSQYILSLSRFLVKIIGKFKSNSEIHAIKTRQSGRESTRMLSAADWSGLVSESGWGEQHTGVRGRDESHATPGPSPRRTCPDWSDALLFEWSSRPFFLPCVKPVGGRPGFNRGQRAPLIRASAEAPPCSIPGLRPLRRCGLQWVRWKIRYFRATLM
jgi:hypothetical protein